MKQEDLGPQLYLRASHRDPWIAMTPRDVYPAGAGLQRSAFTIQRSEPDNDEESWPIVSTVNADGPACAVDESGDGACSRTWNQAQVGYSELIYGPEQFALVGPTLCQDELAIQWRSVDFWEKYFISLERRNVRSLENRLANIFMNLVPHAGVYSPFAWGDVMAFNGQSLSKCSTNGAVIPPNQVYIGDIGAPTTETYGELTQEVLDLTAVTLIEEGQTDPDSQGWITMGGAGPIFPLLIGMEMSARLLLNNSEFRADVRSAWESLADANPLLKRRGASQVIKNWRHLVTAKPPRWDFVTEGTDGDPIGPAHLYTEPNSGLVYGASTDAINTPYGATPGCWVRRPVFVNEPAVAPLQKGFRPEINPDWQAAEYEGAIAMSPWVFTEEILRPINAVSNMKWQAQNYMGEWNFVTGNDAFIGIDSCEIPSGGDPLHTKGRHFAQYKHAAKPVFPQYGRLIIFKRCVPAITIASCS
jgi:hypothetical protein